MPDAKVIVSEGAVYGQEPGGKPVLHSRHATEDMAKSRAGKANADATKLGVAMRYEGIAEHHESALA